MRGGGRPRERATVIPRMAGVHVCRLYRRRAAFTRAELIASARSEWIVGRELIQGSCGQRLHEPPRPQAAACFAGSTISPRIKYSGAR